MRLIDADALKRKSQKVATEAWKLRIKATVEVILNQFIDYIDAAPTIKPEQQWILCSERLPENNRQVLVYARSVHFALAKYDEMREADGTYKMQWVTFDAWKPFYKIKEVVAWMPLPEPYQEGEQDDSISD